MDNSMEEKRQHTPAPWLIGEDQCVDECWSIVTTSGGAIIATPAREAADDMLAALVAVMDINDNGVPFGGELYQDRVERALTNARAALAKAKGTSL